MKIEEQLKVKLESKELKTGSSIGWGEESRAIDR